MKIVTLTEKQFDDYARLHKYKNHYQTSKYGKLMNKNGFNVHYLGFEDKNGKLFGASLILYRHLLFGFKYAYAPRGFLLDYNNHHAITDITKNLQRLLFKQKYVFIKIDPLIECSKRDKDGKTIYFNSEINDILSTLSKTKYKHMTFNTNFENLKPRWHAILNMTPNTNKLFDQFEKNIKNKIRKAQNYKIEVNKVTTTEELEEFYNLVKHKDGKSLKYYEDFSNIYKDDFEIYTAKVDFSVIVKEAKANYELNSGINANLSNEIQKLSTSGEDITKLLNRKIESDKLVEQYKNDMIESTKYLNKYNEGLIIGGIAIIKHDGEIYTHIEGYNKEFSRYNGNYLLRWYLIDKYAKEGYVKYNLNAISGDFTKDSKYKGLNESKLSFNAEAIEYIGEFNYVINPFMYAIYNIRPVRRRINKKAE